MKFHRQRDTQADAPAQRAGEPWACLGIPARGASAGGERGLAALAEAFGRAAHPTAPTDLAAALVEQQHDLDLHTTLYAFRCLLGVVCHQTGETPRSILEAEFAGSPSDEFWRAGFRA